MADTVDKETRSRMMAAIRGKNTKPEMVLRKALHARSFRYRLHGKGIIFFQMARLAYKYPHKDNIYFL